MDTVRHAWTLLEWKDAKQAKQWFHTAAKSDEPTTAYYGLEGMADCDAALGEQPQTVLAAYAKARRYADAKVLDALIHKRLREREAKYQAQVIALSEPGGRWQGEVGRRALERIGEGQYGADKDLRLNAYETLGDRAWAASSSRNAAEVSAGAWRKALNQEPDNVARVRLEHKIQQAEARLPGHHADDDEAAYDQAGLVADPALLALMGRCSQCGGQGGKQRRACAEVAQTYTLFYGPGARRPGEGKVKRKVKELQVKLTDSGCF